MLQLQHNVVKHSFENARLKMKECTIRRFHNQLSIVFSVRCDVKRFDSSVTHTSVEVCYTMIYEIIREFYIRQFVLLLLKA